MKFRDEYYFLSNMFPCKIILGNIEYTCVESAYQSFKTLNEKDRLINTSGFEAKRLGRYVNIRADWDNIKLGVMRVLLGIKFKDPELLYKLKSIKCEIVEDNNWNDLYWGKCNGEGRNELGKLLMKIRDMEG